MYSRFPTSLLVLAGFALFAGGCDREERRSRAKPIGETIPPSQAPGPLKAGNPPLISPGPPGPGVAAKTREAAYEDNAHAIAQGMKLYTWMNCVGCHANGGGGMGPALMDAQWRYGGRIDQIAATIAHGRPNGMPAWRSKLTDDQIWQLAAYVRSLSGQVRKDALGARADTVRNTPPMTQIVRKPMVPGQ